MKLNKYQREVLSVALDILEHNGDDSWMDIEENPKLFKAYNQLAKACVEPRIPIKKYIKILDKMSKAITDCILSSKDKNIYGADLLKKVQIPW